MKKTTPFKIILSFFLLTQICFAQVDVVYKDLVWSDEFDGAGIINSTNWFQQTKLPDGFSWFSNEVQHYTNRVENSFVDGGFLNIVAIKEPFTDQGQTKDYTSARLNSKKAFLYGRIDVRAKVPIGAGTWPAIWMLGKNINEPGAFFSSTYGTTSWPACGEIDIMEHGIFPSKSVNYVQSTLHSPSSYGGSVNNGGIEASDLANNYHVYSLNWSPNQISFLLDNVLYYTYNPSVKDDGTWPFDKEQYLLLNVAMGGTAGAIPSNFTKASMSIDYVRVYQNKTVDNEPPTNFTATVGTISGSSVELLLNGTDNSGNVTYTVDYESGTKTTFSPSGSQKLLVISDLVPNTNYTFTVTATDSSGNMAVNNPILLNAKTTTVLQCTGNSVSASQGSFSAGYNYSFETIGTDVKITFELLDTDKSAVAAFELWRQSPFLPIPMTVVDVPAKKYSQTITNQSIGSTISYACKFAYFGGMSVTKYFPYVVGSNCSLGIENPLKLQNSSYPNPFHNTLFLELTDQKNRIILNDFLGRKLFESTVPANYNLDMSSYKTGLYFLRVENSLGTQELKVIKQ